MLAMQCTPLYPLLYMVMQQPGTEAALVAEEKLNREVAKLFTAHAVRTPVLVDTLQLMLASEPDSLVPDAALPLCALSACRALIIRLLLRHYPDVCAPCLGASRSGDVSPEVRIALGVCAGAFVDSVATCTPSPSSPLTTHNSPAKRSRSARSSDSAGPPRPAGPR